MSTDGDLRSILRKSLPQAQWTTVETGLVQRGVPDCEYCFEGGRQGWVECKRTTAWAVEISALQVAWLSRRSRIGGHAWVAVRRIAASARDQGADELWLVRGEGAKTLRRAGLKAAAAAGYVAGVWKGGPPRWHWEEVRACLTSDEG